MNNEMPEYHELGSGEYSRLFREKYLPVYRELLEESKSYQPDLSLEEFEEIVDYCRIDKENSFVGDWNYFRFFSFVASVLGSDLKRGYVMTRFKNFNSAYHGNETYQAIIGQSRDGLFPNAYYAHDYLRTKEGEDFLCWYFMSQKDSLPRKLGNLSSFKKADGTIPESILRAIKSSMECGLNSSSEARYAEEVLLEYWMNKGEVLEDFMAFAFSCKLPPMEELIWSIREQINKLKEEGINPYSKGLDGYFEKIASQVLLMGILHWVRTLKPNPEIPDEWMLSAAGGSTLLELVGDMKEAEENYRNYKNKFVRFTTEEGRTFEFPLKSWGPRARPAS